MEIKIKSVKDLIELRNSISQIIGLAKDLGLEVIDEDKPSDNFEGFHNPNEDNQVYPIGNKPKKLYNIEECNKIYNIILPYIEKNNIYRPDIQCTTGEPGKLIGVTDKYEIYFDSVGAIFYIKDFREKDAIYVYHMLDDYFDELEK